MFQAAFAAAPRELDFDPAGWHESLRPGDPRLGKTGGLAHEISRE
jgi:hypothetical protein